MQDGGARSEKDRENVGQLISLWQKKDARNANVESSWSIEDRIMACREGKGVEEMNKKSIRTSMWRSVALVKLSVTIESTRSKGKCVGCPPLAGCWFLKYIW